MRFLSVPRVAFSLTIVGVVAWASSLPTRTVAADKGPKPSDEAVARTREQVKMLDDLYKTAVVVMTKTYVDKQLDTPAAVVAAEVFTAMKKQGYHNARLVDATGRPKSKSNAPETEFEKKAIAAIKGGKTYFDEVGEEDGKPVLRVGTIVPAVMKSCASCHGVKENDLLGAVIYEVPIK